MANLDELPKDLPVFQAAGMALLKGLTLIVKNGVVGAVHYPIILIDSDPAWVIDRLKTQ
jgi:hypothetical protein